MTQQTQILNQNDLESLRMYHPDSPQHKLISAKLREIVLRLFRNTDININDFYFTGVADKEPSAFFIPKSKTNTGKHVIAVSYGLIQRLSTTEEFAAIVGHESGHFLWDELLGGKNTIFQERTSDLHSVDLFLNAGYNPNSTVSAFKKVLDNWKTPVIDLGVHGAPMPRIMDVQAYITNKEIEFGDFPPAQTQDRQYSAFKYQFIEAERTHPYATWIQSQIQSNFGTRDIFKINRADLLKFFINNLKNIFTNATRTNEFVDILDELDFTEKNKHETELLQNLFLSTHNLAQTEEYKELAGGWQSRILRASYLDCFGPFTDMINYTRRFINNADDKMMTSFYADKINELKWTAPIFYNITNYKDIKIVDNPTPDIIGKKPAWIKLRDYKQENIHQAFQTIASGNFNNLYYFNTRQYLLDDNNCVIAYGEEAEKIIRQRQNQENIKRANQLLDQESERISRDLDGYIKFSDFMHAHISAKDIAETIPKGAFYHSAFSDYISPISRIGNGEILNCKDDLNRETLLNIYNTIKSSRYYADYTKYGNDPMPDISETATSAEIFTIINGFLGSQSFDMYKKVFRAYINLAQYFASIGRYEDEESIYTKLDTSDYGDKQTYFDSEIPQYASKNIYHLYYHMYRSPLQSKIEKDILDASPEIIENMIETLGFAHLPQNEDELIFFINKIKQIWAKEDSASWKYDDFFKFAPLQRYNFFPNGDCTWEAKKFINYIFFYYLSSGHKCNLAHVIQNFSEAYSAPEFKEVLAKYLTTDMFNSFNLYDKIFLYEYMDTAQLFSEKDANKNKFIKIIVDEIVSQPNNHDCVQYAEKLLTRRRITRMGQEKYDQDIEFANERENLIEFYANRWAKNIGHDDGSKRTEHLAMDFAMFLKSRDPKDPEHRLFSRMITRELTNRVSTKIVSQEPVTRILDSANDIVISNKDAEKYDWYGRAIDNITSILAYNTNTAAASIKFLTSELSDKSIDTLLDTIHNPEKINKQSLTMLYENFWRAGLGLRAYLMNKLLMAYSNSSKPRLDMIVDMYFKPESKYYNDAKLVLESVYDNMSENGKDFILAALVASGKTDDNPDVSDGTAVGRGLKMFLQEKGPAFIKFGQLLSYLPTLDPDIRKELSTMRDHAAIPERHELFDIIKQSVPPSEQEKISHIGKVLGAGSFFITVQITYEGRDCVISLLRPNAKNRTETGIQAISGAIQEMTAADKKYAPLQNIVSQAADSAFSEIDIEQDYQKYKKATEIYDGIIVHTPSGDFVPDVAKWITYGANPKNEDSYKIMEMAPGKPLTSEDLTPEQKHDMAVAYTTLELSILLSGNRWDTDRHAGQQNFYDKSFREFCIGIFDTGAQMRADPNRRDKVMFGYLLYDLITGIQKGKNIGEILTNKVQKIDNLGKIGIDTTYIDGVQRGLTALSDIIQYQKEIKDQDGKIIQPALSLTGQDLEHIATAIINSGLIDKTLANTVRTRAIFDKLMFWRDGLAINQQESDIQETPISIELSGKMSRQILTRKINQTASDLERLEQLKRANEHLGLKKGMFEKESTTPTPPALQPMMKSA